MGHIFKRMPAWDPGLVANAGEDDKADTTITSLGTFVTSPTIQPHITPSNPLLFFQPLHALSLPRAPDVLDVHLESGEILSRRNVPARLSWFLQSIMMGTSKDRGQGGWLAALEVLQTHPIPQKNQIVAMKLLRVSLVDRRILGVKEIHSIFTMDTRNHHEHRTTPRAQQRDIPREGFKKIQTTTTGTARFVGSHPGGPA